MCETRNKLNILLVEDDDANAEALIELISEQSVYKVHRARTCEESLDIFCPNKFIIAFIDLHLDGEIKNGINLIKTLREKDDNLFIIVVSAYSEYIYNKILIESVDDFIRKPVDIDFFSSKLFLWSTKYERRASLRKHIDSKCNYFENKIIDYDNRLEDIKRLDIQIEELANKITGFHPAENYEGTI